MQQSSSDRCYFCGQQVYLVERMSAEGYFFHRGCLKCVECGSRLRLSTYVFHRQPDGRGLFYCFAHYAVRHAGEVSRDLRDYYDDTLYDTAGLQTEGSLPSSRNNNFRTPERAEFQYYAEELREVDEASICDYNRLSVDYLEDEDEEEDDEVMEDDVLDEEEGGSRRHFDRNRKYSWENAVEAARRIATKRVQGGGGAFDGGSSTDLDSTSAGGIDLSDSDLEDEQMPEDLPYRNIAAAPIIHRDSTAKMKFYMEAPKPVQINARHFFAKSNLIKLKFTQLEDATEPLHQLPEPTLESISPTIAQAPSANILEKYSTASTSVGEHSARVTCTDYFAERWELCCDLESQPLQVVVVDSDLQPAIASSPTATTSVTLEDGDQLHSESRTDDPSLTSSPPMPRPPIEVTQVLDVATVPLAFEDLSDIHDIDSSSVPTENSCASDNDLLADPASPFRPVPQPQWSQSPSRTSRVAPDPSPGDTSSGRVTAVERRPVTLNFEASTEPDSLQTAAQPQAQSRSPTGVSSHPSRRSREVSTHSLHSSSSSVDSAPLLDTSQTAADLLQRRKIVAAVLMDDDCAQPASNLCSGNTKEEPYAAESGRKKIEVELSDSSVEDLVARTANVDLNAEVKAEEPIYENFPMADADAVSLPTPTPPSLGHVSNPIYDTVDFPLMDSTADSSAHLSSTNDDRSKSSLPITDSSLRSRDNSPLMTRRRRKRRMRKQKGLGNASGARGSVDSSLADTSAGDEALETRRQKRSSVPLLGRWKGWFSSSSSTGHRRSKQRSLEPEEEMPAANENAAAVQPQPPSECRERLDEEIQRREKRRRQLERERELFEIQCQLEEVESRLRQLEDRGVLAEQSIRGRSSDDGPMDDSAMTDWMSLIRERNELLRLESELTVSSRELELTYRQECLEEQYRRRMAVPENEKTPAEKEEDQQLLNEMVKVVEERNSLVGYLDEMRLEELKKESEANTPVSERGGEKEKEQELSIRDMILLGATKESKLI